MAKRGSSVALPTTVTEPVEEVTPRADEQLAADLAQLGRLITADRVEEARRYVKELEQRWPDAERVKHFVTVLAPPVSRSRPDIPARPHDLEWEWLRAHAHEYPGCWLAVHHDRLIAVDPQRGVVVAKSREVLGEEGALLFFQPEK